MKETIAALSSVNNLRQRIQRLKLEGEELAKYGPAKLPEKQGIDEYSEETIEKGPNYLMDPTGRRTGNGERHRCPMHSVSPIFANGSSSCMGEGAACWHAWVDLLTSFLPNWFPNFSLTRIIRPNHLVPSALPY